MGGKEKAQETIKMCFEKINASAFCTGNNDRGWKADFDWFFTNGNNWVKVSEGKYDNKPGTLLFKQDEKQSLMEYSDGVYRIKDFNEECLRQIRQYDMGLYRVLSRGGQIKKEKGRWHD